MEDDADEPHCRIRKCRLEGIAADDAVQACNINRKRCTVIRKDGTRCNGIAVKNFSRCFHHGGSGVLARRGLYRRKLRHFAWLPRSQLKDEYS